MPILEQAGMRSSLPRDSSAFVSVARDMNSVFLPRWVFSYDVTLKPTLALETFLVDMTAAKLIAVKTGSSIALIAERSK